eukprot:3067382-Amphidinium_carterae.2
MSGVLLVRCKLLSFKPCLFGGVGLDNDGSTDTANKAEERQQTRILVQFQDFDEGNGEHSQVGPLGLSWCTSTPYCEQISLAWQVATDICCLLKILAMPVWSTRKALGG